MAANDINGPRVRDTSGDKWHGPITDNVTVADELQVDALDERTRMVTERVGAGRVEAAADGGYSMGYDDGKEKGKDLARTEWEAEKAELERQLVETNKEISKLLSEGMAADEENGRLRRALQTIASAKVVNLADAATVAKQALAA